MTNARRSLAGLTLIALVGCSATGNSSDTEITLDSCTTSIAADAPLFFQRYFRCVTVTMSGSNVIIASTGLPPHKSPYYGVGHPNYEAFDTSRGSEYRQNPNVIADEGAFTLEIPSAPTARNVVIDESSVDGVVRTSTTEYGLGAAGVALDGVGLFNPLAGPGDDIENEKFTFDSYDAHPQQQGEYHYHSSSKGPLEVLKKAGLVTSTTPGSAELEVYGIMCDGTVVLGCTELDKSTPDDPSLDAQGGHKHDLKDAEGAVLFAARYHTHICAGRYAFKYTPEIQYYSTCTVR